MKEKMDAFNPNSAGLNDPDGPAKKYQATTRYYLAPECPLGDGRLQEFN